MSFTLVTRIVQNLFGPQRAWQVNLLNIWPDIASTLGTKVTIEKLYKETIVLGVQDSCWLQELYLLSPTLLHRINQTLDHPRLKKVRFKKLGIQKKMVKKRSKRKIRTPLEYQVTEREQKALGTIKNQELKNALTSFLIRCHGERGNEKEAHT
jgi:hypothetical protein